MTKKQIFFSALVAALLAPAAASAAPVVGWVAATLAVSTATAAFIVNIGFSLVLSSLSAALRKKPGLPRPPGIKTESTTSGGSNPQTFILGKYATAGNMVAPPYSHPNSGDLPNKWLTYVVDVSDMPGVQLSRVMVAGEYVADLDERENVPGAHDLQHDLAGMVKDGKVYMYLTWHDGSQTAADPYMLEHYADHPDRPWSADMVGTGVAYAVLTFHYNRKLFNQLPGVRFEVLGIPLYDPRKDDTAGGSGAHRWADPATWEYTANPIVMVYNILRGITLPDGQRWGGKVSASGLPLDSWFAAMNECDVQVQLKGGGSEPQFEAGLEVSLDEEPAEVIGELLKACSAEISEFGGTYKVRVGPPALPVYFFTDDDVVVEHPQSLTPYPGLDGVHNGIHATHPDPESLWETRDAPPRYNAEWEAEDGGRQLVASVELPAVGSGTQVQRLMKGWIEDERRFRRHSLTLPPDAAVLEPLDCVAWTSAREGYTSKVFEVGELTDDLTTCVQTVAMRERDAGDFTWTPGTDEVGVDHPSTVVTVLGPRSLPGFDLLAHSMPDGSGTARRPALRLIWEASDLLTGDVVEWEIQLADETLVAAGTAASPLTGEAVFAAGILPLTGYRARARVRDGGDGIWSGWKSVSTGDVRLGYIDLAPQIQAEITAAQDAADSAAADATSALAGAADAQSKVNAVIALDGGALPGTEFENLVTQLQVGVDGVSATITDHAAAVADMEGFAAAFAGVTVETSGGKIAGFKATSWVNPNGTGGGTLELLGDVIAEGSLSANRFVAGIGKNLLENPDFTQGLGVGVHCFSDGEIGATATHVLRNDGTNSEAFYPTIRLRTELAAVSSDGYVAATFYPMNDDGTEASGYPVKPGAWYEFSAGTRIRRVMSVLRLYWYDANGDYIDFDNVHSRDTTGYEDPLPPMQWQRYGGLSQAPANAAYCRPQARIIETMVDSNLREMYVFQPMFCETVQGAQLSPYSPGGSTYMHGGRLATDSVYAEAMNTVSFAAAGLAIFGNALQSSNFNGTIDGNGDITGQGSAGWAISKSGEMVLNNLVARDWVQVGAVSDGADYARSSTIGLDHGDVLTTVSLGAFQLGQFWQIACQVKFRSRSVTSTYYDGGKGDPYYSITWERTQVKLEWQTKSGGSWSGWSELHNFGTTGNSNSWTTKDEMIPKHGDYDDVEVRIRVYISNDTYQNVVSEGNSTWNNVDDVSLVAKSVVR